MTNTVRVHSSSSNELYYISFDLGATMSIKCNCKAGLSKLVCKHRLDLLDRNTKSLHIDDIEIYNQLMQSLDIERVKTLLSRSNEIDTQIKQLETQRKKIKKEIGIQLSDGF